MDPRIEPCVGNGPCETGKAGNGPTTTERLRRELVEGERRYGDGPRLEVVSGPEGSIGV